MGLIDLDKYDIVGLNEQNQLSLNMFIVLNEINIATKRVGYFVHHLYRCVKDTDKAKLTVMVIVNASQIAGLIGVLQGLHSDLIKTFPQPKKPMLLLPPHKD